MTFFNHSEFLSVSLEELRSAAKKIDNERLLHCLSYQDDPEILENVAKNVHISSETIDNILERLESVCERIEKYDLPIPEGEVYPGYWVDFVRSKVETFETRIYFACGWNPKISPETLHSIIKKHFRILIRAEKYHSLNNLLLKNSNVSQESIDYILNTPSHISAETVKFLTDVENLDKLAKNVIKLFEENTWFSESELHKIIMEFTKNTVTSAETISFLVRFIKYSVSSSIQKINNDKSVEEELCGFANHKNTDSNTLDILVLGNNEKISQAVSRHPNVTDEIRKKIEFMTTSCIFYR